MVGFDFNFHLIRHHFATTLLERGVDLATVAGLMGHSKEYVTTIYAHTTPEKQKKAVDLLAD